MSESKLRTQSMDFAVSIINLVKYLKEKRESIISNQIGRSGTSIGANIREAQYAHGKADFIAKNSNVKLKQIVNINYSTQPLNVNFGLEYNHLRTDKCFANARVPEMTPEDKLVEKTIDMVWEIE